METNSSLVNQHLTEASHRDNDMDVLLLECRALMRLEWTVEIRRVYHEANCVADGLAN